ncbi:MAG: hypothetical protein DRG78_23510 [Epsilonproteobacteria bacterium]|nr:MAG: hypothetical protein DRG78_23510 [Campylobacterota bacterium]
MDNILCNKCIVKSCCTEYCNDLKEYLNKKTEVLGKLYIEDIYKILNKERKCLVCNSDIFETRIFNIYRGNNSEMRCSNCSTTYTFELNDMDLKLIFITTCLFKSMVRNFIKGNLTQIKDIVKRKLIKWYADKEMI